MRVVLLLGSESDFEVVKGALETLKEFEVSYALEVTSAHRSPERTVELVSKFEEEGAEVFIAVAGKSAHLAGVVAAHTLRPVIGVPVGSAPLNGMDALFSTVNMPKGVPVACMGLGKSGAVNAVLLAVQMLGLKDSTLKSRLEEYKKDKAQQVEQSSRRVKEKL